MNLIKMYKNYIFFILSSSNNLLYQMYVRLFIFIIIIFKLYIFYSYINWLKKNLYNNCAQKLNSYNY